MFHNRIRISGEVGEGFLDQSGVKVTYIRGVRSVLGGRVRNPGRPELFLRAVARNSLSLAHMRFW